MHLACLLASSLAAAAASSSSSSSSALITLSLPPAPNPFALAPGTHATLWALGARYSAPLSSLNTFVFRNVSPGSYLADVHCPSDAFRPLRIDVDADGRVHAWDTYRGNDWGNKGEVASRTSSSSNNNGAAQDVVVEVKSLGKKLYYMERPAFSVLSILKNPMILMGLVSMLIFFGMPKLMENMDPEMKAEFEAQQRKSPLNAVMGGGGGGGGGAQANPLGNFDMAAFLAGSKQKDTSSGGAAPDARNEAVRR